MALKQRHDLVPVKQPTDLVPVKSPPDPLRTARNHARRDRARLTRLREAFDAATRAEDVTVIQAEIDQLELEMREADKARRRIAQSRSIYKAFADLQRRR